MSEAADAEGRSKVLATGHFTYSTCTTATPSAHGLDGQALWEVTQATLVARLLYASSAWSGSVKSEERTKLQLILNKASRYGFLPAYFGTIDELFESSDDTLFNHK